MWILALLLSAAATLTAGVDAHGAGSQEAGTHPDANEDGGRDHREPIHSAQSAAALASGERFGGLFVVAEPTAPFPNAAFITILAPDGSVVRRLEKVERGFNNPRWSPDGRRIVFGSNYDIFVVNADGTGLVNLTTSPDLEFFPSWSPDGARIAFTRTPVAQGAMRTYIVNADGSGIAMLPTSFHFQATDWSPDGQWLVGRGGSTSANQVLRVHRSGSEFTVVGKMAGVVADARFSPDGTEIVWSRNPPNGVIMISGTDGADERPLIDTQGNDLYPTWAPDGSHVLFWSGGNIAAVTPDGADFVPWLKTPVAISEFDLQRLPLAGRVIIPMLAIQ